MQNENDMRKHKKSQHTYHSECNECEFMANEVETLNVHFGIKHSQKSQCGLCDKVFENSASLATHLTKCNIFMCANSSCGDYFETLTEMKDHINEHHRENAPAHYTFSYWVVDSKGRSKKEIKKRFNTLFLKDL